MTTFEATIREFTNPLNGQYPRPWMTRLVDPTLARVLIVGKNQAKGYPVEQVGSHERHLDALFNRNNQTCRGLYDLITRGKPSPTRRNLDTLTSRLQRQDVSDVLETNVICYSTPLSRDLASAEHRGGQARGEEIFRYLLGQIGPAVTIVHGAGATRKLAKVLHTALPEPPDRDGDIRSKQTDHGTVFILPSLAPPKYNSWSSWASGYLDRVALAVAKQVKCL